MLIWLGENPSPRGFIARGGVAANRGRDTLGVQYYGYPPRGGRFGVASLTYIFSLIQNRN